VSWVGKNKYIYNFWGEKKKKIFGIPKDVGGSAIAQHDLNLTRKV
jgi:hypothetical protein